MSYNYLSSRGKERNAAADKGGRVYLNAAQQVQDALSKKNKALEDAANAIAAFATRTDTSNKGALVEQLQSMLQGFTEREQCEILRNSLATLIVNM